MNYRLYVKGSGGYTDLGTYNSEETVECLHWLIIEEKTKEHILAIECNEQRKFEFPVFIYGGNPLEFVEFKQYLETADNKSKVTNQYVKKNSGK